MTASELDLINRERVVARLLSAGLHEARNSLQAIAGAAELLAMGGGAVPVESRARGLQAQALGLGDRLEYLLQLAAERPVQTVRLDVSRLCGRALDLRRPSWGRLRVTGDLAVGPGTVVRADEQRAVRILVNLLLNAEAATLAADTRRITLTASADGPTVALTIEDSGPGVPAEAETRLFTSVGPVGRLATGLVVSRALAEAMGGSLVWAGPTRRAAFTLTLPVG